MNKYFLIFKLFCGVFWLKNEAAAEVATCYYDYEDWPTASYYKCQLYTNQSSYDEKSTSISGEHKANRNNADVTIIENYCSEWNIFSTIFCKTFPNLEVININNAKIESVDEDSLLGCKKLKRLQFFDLFITEIPEFWLIENENLTFLKIYSGGLKTLHHNSFINQRMLKVLILTRNRINFLPSSIFVPLVNLEELYLDYNSLESIDPKWFTNLQNLKSLKLDVNYIKGIPSKCFISLKNLDNLSIIGNRIRTLKSDCFNGLQNLQILSLYDNEIFYLPSGVFGDLKNLQKLFLDDNKLTTISSDSFGIHNQLTTVYLQDNKIIAIDPKFIDNTAVSTLNMTGNFCSQFYTEVRNEIKPKLMKCFDNYQPRVQDQIKCIKSKSVRESITGGQQVNKGDLPWNAVLLTSKGHFLCGGTLVSSRKVVTAANYIHQKKSSDSLKSSDLTVVLGAHDLKKSSEIGRVSHAVAQIHVHPDWSNNIDTFDTFEGDIAVLVLEKEVTFNDYVQPICMSLDTSSATSGVVVGHSFAGETEEIPTTFEIPISNINGCFDEDNDLVLIASERTFCGGSGNGFGASRGDYGGGLVVNYGGAYYLRGIMALPFSSGRYEYDYKTYFLYTDVLKFMDWIYSKMQI